MASHVSFPIANVMRLPQAVTPLSYCHNPPQLSINLTSSPSHELASNKTQPRDDVPRQEMAPKNNAKGGGDKKGKGGAKDDDQGGKSGKGAAAGLKPATAINVRHILVRSCHG